MAGIKDQMKMVRELQKAQKELKKEIIEVEAGDGAVVIQFTGELKVKSVKLDPELIDFEDTEELISLYQTMDRIKNRFGTSSVGRASGFLK